MSLYQLEKLFSPKSIAVFGASEKENGVGTRVFGNLIGSGFSGELYPVNPKHESVAGHRCYASVSEIEGPVDLAVIAAPAKVANHLMRECGEKGITAAIVLSAGFRETGDQGTHLENQLADTARHYNIDMMGPNCLGLIRPQIGLNATFLDIPAPAGKLALISQSGALCTAILDWAEPHKLGFSTVVSLGNAADIDFGNVLDFLAVDPQTNAILLYVEGIHDSRTFMSGLRAAARSKPVIVLKAGRHSSGSQAAATHSGAMIGSDDVFDAALERAGVVRAMTFGQLFAAAEILSSGTRVHGNRLAIVTNGGGPGVLATDRAEDLRVELAELASETIVKLDSSLPKFWSRGNPVDILGDALPEKYGEAVEACLKDPNVDGVLTLLTPQAMSKPQEAAEMVVQAAKKHPEKPVICSWMGETKVLTARDHFSKNKIPNFVSPERAVEAFSYLSRYHANHRLLLQTPGPLSNAKTPDVEGARLIIEAALSDGRKMLSDTESKAVLNAFRIRCTPTFECQTSTEALVAAETVGFPVAMKINSPQISHKSDVGGVRINIPTASDIRSIFNTITHDAREARPDAQIKGVTVEPMASSGDSRELMVGVKRDPVFGPVIGFGAGGTMAEVLQDNAVALPPLNSILTRRLINRTRVAKLLGPYRQMAPIDKTMVEDVLLRVSDMVCELPHIEEMDINPLICDENNIIAADVRIRISRPTVAPELYAHMAIHPYPQHLISHKQLSDGTDLTIRPIRPEDADIEQEFVRNLSPQSKYFRFMQHIEELTPEALAYFTQIDYSREMALIGVVIHDGAPLQVGVVRYTTNPDGRSCEFALAVSDQYQHKGIGSILMKAMMEAARNQGIHLVVGDVLTNNRRMLSLMKELGFSVRGSPEDVSVRVVERWI